MKHIQKKGFAAYHRRDDGTAACPELEELVESGYLETWFNSMFGEGVYKLTEKGEKPAKVACRVISGVARST